MLPLRDTIRARYPPLANWALIGINGLVFLFQLTLPDAELTRVVYLFGIVPARFTHPDWAAWAGFPTDTLWPFVTSMFLHGGFLHLLANVWTLFIFGDNVEDRMGPVRYTLFYLVCGTFSGVVHWATHLDSRIPTIGASGAIAAVLGAYLRMYPRARILTVVPVFIIPFFFEIPAFFFLGIWFLTQLFQGTFSLGGSPAGGVAWWAHIGGFLAGMFLYPLFLSRARQPPLLELPFEPPGPSREPWDRF